MYYSRTSLIRTRLIRIPDNTYKQIFLENHVPTMFFSFGNISDKENEFWPFIIVRINKVLLYRVHIFYKGFSSFTLLVLIYFTGVDFGHNYVDSGVKFEISLQNPKIVLQSRFFYMSNINFLYRYVQQSIRNIPKLHIRIQFVP